MTIKREAAVRDARVHCCPVRRQRWSARCNPHLRSPRGCLVDMGGFTVSEDNRFPDSFYTFTPDGPPVPFTRDNLEPICDDLISDGVFTSLASATLDGTTITGTVLDSGVFSSRVNRHAVIPG